ncbi:5'-methylthioadenosine/S-adenosylhomocysteine nucleosidase [Frondihabitans australicus]|uniref:adenosylhomocysteine nucleosidase n=1 Tax=Frondihabitans australicus TaxID=386892 RepID=A0A495IJT2_9MICO|nr:5'-methylthioadenosine/S-adenosylhomocysteine nucleosidase [Frondihabitans australicus]RKR75980.1 adenosylhomocysteine nucleosidase [Frondihabitans australicus]
MSGFPAGSVSVDAVVITAMAEEAEPFLSRATTVADPARYGHAEHRIVTLDGRTILVVRSGIGLVNAAAATAEALLLVGAPDPAASRPLVVSAGSAGGVGADVRVGDVIVGTTTVNGGADAQVFGYAPGQTPQMPASYAADAGALAAAASLTSVADAAGVPIVVRQGLIVSSDAFVATPDAVARVRAGFPGVLATEMETLAIAQVCSVYGFPFVSIRGISDLAVPPPSGDFDTHVDDAADRSARVVLALLAALSSSPAS